MGSRAAVAGGLAALALGACGPQSVPAPSCEELGVVVEAAGPAERRVLGAGAPYEADGSLAARRDELQRSQRARRQAAWAAVARVLAPTALSEPTPVSGATVPAFRTWHDRDDLDRMFQHAYAAIGPERRAARAAFTDAELDGVLAWNVRAVDGIEGWSEERFATFVAGLHAPATLAGLGGFRRVALSPGAARHVLGSYADIERCLGGERPAPFVDGPAGPRTLATLPLALVRCHEALVGPYFVASGATLTARRVEGDAAEGRVSIHPSVDGLAGPGVCDASLALGCAVGGPGTFFVGVGAAGADLRGSLEIAVEEPGAIAPGCVRGAFPLDAVTVAAHWQRADLGLSLPTYDTSARALARRFDDGTYSWGAGDATADPGPDAIYTMTLPVGTSYRLAGMHIRTRELEHWLNITLWWSPEPDTDFGEDRPAAIRALGAPWSEYKMCVAIDFEEGDLDPSGGFGEDAASLAAALEVVHERASWCSNPYIDAAPGLLRGNCVGCHQHAMGGLAPGVVALDEARFPNGGRARARNNAPGDGLWSLDGGDDLGATLRDTIAWWAASE